MELIAFSVPDSVLTIFMDHVNIHKYTVRWDDIIILYTEWGSWYLVWSNDLPLAIKLEDGRFQYDSIMPGPC